MVWRTNLFKLSIIQVSNFVSSITNCFNSFLIYFKCYFILVSDDDVDDCGEECVVCLCDLRDTLILPCRHLCLCYACADSLRYQASNCPICRIPFRALLQIRAVQKVGQVTHPAMADPDLNQDGFPSGFKLVSLVEVMNGPLQVHNSPTKSKKNQKKKKKKDKTKSRTKKSSSTNIEASNDAKGELLLLSI
jgi:hypothetical protein